MPSKATIGLLNRLERVKKSGSGWVARCPAHEDHNPSLSITEGTDGRVLLNCHAGCDVLDVCTALSIEVGALFEEEPHADKAVIAEYPYVDEDGKLLYVKERLYPKDFRFKRPDGKGGWEYKLGRTPRPLYHLPELLAAKAAGTRVYYVEGERDVRTLQAHGLVATTAGGVNDFRPAHAEVLKGCDLVVIADNDQEGRKLALSVSAATGAPVVVSERGKDITAHYAAGGDVSDLVPLSDPPVLAVIDGGKADALELVSGVRDGDAVIGETRIPEHPDMFTFESSAIRRDRYGVHGETRIDLRGVPLAHSMINLSKHEDRTRLANAAADRLGDKSCAAALRLRLDHFAMNVWEWWTQASGPAEVIGGCFSPPRFVLEPYIIEGGITMLYGPPKSGKSYIGLLMALTLRHGVNAWSGSEATSPVAFINLERPPDTVGYRMQRLAQVIGVPDRLVIQHEQGRKFTDVAPSTIRWLERNPGGVIILDSLSRMGAGDLNSNEDTNRAMDLLHSLKASVVVLAHTPRSDATHVFGSVMHDAAADVLVRCEKTKGESPGLMGVRVSVDDGNDVGWVPPKTWAFEFRTGEGLIGVRPAQQSDFPDLADVRPIRERAKEYLRVIGDASTKDIADELGVEVKSLRTALRRDPATFLSAAPGGGGKGDQAWWTLAPEPQEEQR